MAGRSGQSCSDTTVRAAKMNGWNFRGEGRARLWERMSDNARAGQTSANARSEPGLELSVRTDAVEKRLAGPPIASHHGLMCSSSSRPRPISDVVVPHFPRRTLAAILSDQTFPFTATLAIELHTLLVGANIHDEYPQSENYDAHRKVGIMCLVAGAWGGESLEHLVRSFWCGAWGL